MDEQQAIARLKQGDLAGLECLVHTYQAKAVHTAYLITGDPAAAEDVVQGAFIRLAQHMGQFDPQRPFGPWFLRAVINDALKVAGRQKRMLSLEEADQGIPGWLLDSAPRPEELAERGELRQAVWKALQQLSPEQRAAIVQRHYLGMGEAEMVTRLQRPASTVKWWLHTARERLKTLLAPYHGETAGESHEKR